MKKTLVALAVLAASGASMAQSSVTLYGIADVYFGSESNDTYGTTKTTSTSLSQTKVSSGSFNGSRFGLRGSEDLGGGLNANFQLEGGFNIDTGALRTAGSVFDRQSWVGVSGNFGALRVGNTTTPYDDVSGAATGAFDSSFAPYSNVFRSVKYTGRPGNMLYYQAPTMSGFSGAVSYNFGEDKTATVDASSNTSLNLTYSAGPLAAQLGYQTQKPAAVNAVSIDFTRLGASYDFGPAKLIANYGQVAGFSTAATQGDTSKVSGVSGTKATEYQIGVDVPFGATTLSASFATSQDQQANGNDADKRSGFGLAVKHALSKRTFVYGGYTSDTTSATAVTNAVDLKHSLFAVGMQHRF